MITLAGVTLPGDLDWPDEFEWGPVTQQVDVSTAGALLIEESAQAVGRPITLRSGNNGNQWWGLVTREIVLDLQALAATPRGQAAAMTLVLEDAREFDVLFRHGDGGMEARPVSPVAPAVDSDLYAITLRLITV